MKKLAFILLLVLVPLVFAKTETTKALNINGTATVYGKTLTILSASSIGQLKVSVDGVEGIVRPGVNRTSNVNEMHVEILNFTYIDKENIDAILKIIVNDECGDKACNITETKQSCCTDCGCEGNLKCINNICMKEDCVIDADCDDDDPCTVDKCSGIPKTCSNTVITQCVNNDDCCLDTCDAKNDNDCVAEEEIVKIEPKVEVPEEVTKPEEVLITEKEKGILIIIGVALLVVIIGFLVFGRK